MADQGKLLRARDRAWLAGLVLKAMLIAVALALFGLGGYLIWPAQHQTPEVQQAAPESPTRVAAYKAELSGMDKDQLPYTIHAVKSLQDQAKPDVINLEIVDGTFARSGGKTYLVTANRAQYDKKSKELELLDGVQISDAPRMVAKMQSAHVSTEKREFTSTSPVAVTLENGDVTANQLLAYNNGERLLFRGNVKARIER